MDNNHHLLEAGMLTSGMTIGNALMAWLGENATAISVLISILTFIMSLVFLTLNYMLSKERLKNGQ